MADFDRLLAAGRLDFDSGAWDHESNLRFAHCGRCGQKIWPGEGKPYNEFMTDHFRATTRYLCSECWEAI